MSGEFNYNISPAYGHRRGSDYPPYSSNDRNHASTTLISPLGPSVTSSRVANRGPNNPWLGRSDIRTWERLPTTGLPFPSLVINNGPRTERTIFQAPTFTGGIQDHHEPPSRLSPDEQTRAVGQLKKTTYNPGPKRMASRLCLYYRDQARVIPKEEDEGKRCAVCLEDFEAEDAVMLTPCDHMFHEDCIVPWATSQGQCPVCRFALASSKNAPSASASAAPPRAGAAIGNGGGSGGVGVDGDGVLSGDLSWFVQVVEEAMMRGNRLPSLIYY